MLSHEGGLSTSTAKKLSEPQENPRAETQKGSQDERATKLNLLKATECLALTLNIRLHAPSFFGERKNAVEFRLNRYSKRHTTRGFPDRASCVQRFDDSLNSAIRIKLSHFAAFFIVARTKISVAKSCSFVS